MLLASLRRQPLHLKRMASQVKDATWLDWIAGLMGRASRQTQTATFSPGQFHCLLDELPLHLIPQWQQIESRHCREKVSRQPLFLNPHCTFVPQGQVPEELASRRHLLENFAPGRLVWVRDSADGSLHPFWLSPRWEQLLSGLRKAEPIPDSVPEKMRSLLADAGILIGEGQAGRRAAEWSEVVRKGSQQFREKGYAPLRNLIHPFNLAALRRYYRHTVRTRAIRLGDEQCPLRYGAHNESVARFFHYQIANAVQSIVGEPIKPSYVYWASYVGGAELEKHTDRQQCQFSVTLCVDFSPEPSLATSWPLRLATPEGTVTVYQALGDGLLYRGTKVPHYRDVLAKGQMSTSIFFHYVPADFSGSLD